MAVPADEDRARHPVLPEQLEQPLALEREVRPLLARVGLVDDQNAGADDADLRRLAQDLLEPRPLLGAEERGRRIGAGNIAPSFRRIARILLKDESAAVVAGIESDDLDALARWTEGLRVVNALKLPAR